MDKRPYEFEQRMIDNAFNAVFGVGSQRQVFRDQETNCPQCGKKVKAIGLQQHINDKHTTGRKELG